MAIRVITWGQRDPVDRLSQFAGARLSHGHREVLVIFSEFCAMDEEEQAHVVEEMTLTLEAYTGKLVVERDALLQRVRERQFDYFGDWDIRDRAEKRLELLGRSCYVFYSFKHCGSGHGRFVKVGSTVCDPEARAYAHLISSSSRSDIIGAFGARYVADARLGLIVFHANPVRAREMDRQLNQILKPEIGS
jgi:hypothetical protein